VTHFVGAAPSATSPCQAVPEGDGLLSHVARAMRQLACDPALFFEKTADVRAKLKLPDGVDLKFSGPRTASLELAEKHPAKDLAAALGIEKPVITTGRSGAWALRNWRLGSNPEDGELDLWTPGVVTVGVTHDYSVDDKFGAVKPLTDAEQLRGWVTVTMPETVLKVRDDKAALELLKRALHAFTSDKQLSSAPPEQVTERTGLDERFRVARRSIGTGDDAVHSIDIWTARTYIGAEAVLTLLGLSGEIRHSQARDSSEYRLGGGGVDKHEYNGLTLTLRFDRRPGTKGEDNADFELDAITVW
jgi:hypothetical protein